MEENLRGATDLLLLWHILPHLEISHAHSTTPQNFSCSFYHTLKFLKLILPHLEISPTLSTTPQNFLCSFYHTLKFLMLILRHLGVSWVHSTAPWIFSSSFCDTLSFLVLILQYEHLLISPSTLPSFPEHHLGPHTSRGSLTSSKLQPQTCLV